MFNWLQSEGAIATEEMLRTFNCGLGMVAIVAPEDVQAVLDETDREARVIGKVLAIKEGSPQVNVRYAYLLTSYVRNLCSRMNNYYARKSQILVSYAS